MDLDSLHRGIALFNRDDYFEAHEVLEDVWRAAAPEQKQFLQGLVQIAVALHHYSRANLAGAGSVLRRAIGNLSQPCPLAANFDLPTLLSALDEVQGAIGSGEAYTSAPRIRIKLRS